MKGKQMNVKAITDSIMVEIAKEFPGDAVDSLRRIDYAISRAVGSVISGLSPVATDGKPNGGPGRDTCGALSGQYGTGWTCLLPTGHDGGHAPVAEATTATLSHEAAWFVTMLTMLADNVMGDAEHDAKHGLDKYRRAALMQQRLNILATAAFIEKAFR